MPGPVQGLLEIEFNDLRAAFPNGFPMQDKPAFGITDPIGQNASTAFPQYNRADGRIISGNDSISIPGAGNIEFDSQAEVVYPRSLFVLHDNLLTAYGSAKATGPDGLPTMDWYDFKTDSPLFNLLQVKRAPGYSSLRFESKDPGDFTILGASYTSCQGFTGFLRIGGPEQLSSACYSEMRFRVSGSARGVYRWFSIAYIIGVGVQIGYNDYNNSDDTPDESKWQYLDRAKLGNNLDDILQPRYVSTTNATSTNPAQEPDTHVLDVRIMGGKLRFLFGDQQTPFIFPAMDADNYGTPDYVMDAWMVVGAGVLMTEWSVHETKFVTRALAVSQEINLGFTPSDSQLANVKYRVHYLPNFYSGGIADASQVGWHPSGCVAAVGTYDVNGTVIRYGLIFSNPVSGNYQGTDYSDLTSAVNAVTIDFPGVVYDFQQGPIVLGTDGAPSMPESVDVYHDWDQSVLSVRSRCELEFNNFYGTWTNAQGDGIIDSNGAFPGHFAVRVNMGIVGLGTIKREFTGIGNRDFTNNSQQGRDSLTISCEDRWAMLDVDVFNLPWFDGWNIYSVLATLAQYGTVAIEPDQMGFYDFIPYGDNGLNPYLPSPGLPDDQQYFMPSGPAGTNLTRFSDGQNLRSIMLKITNAIGFYCYFDVHGVLQAGKFHTGESLPVKTFTGFGTTDLQEMFTSSFRGSLRETRNSVTVIGVNALGPLWFPIVAHSLDTESIYNPRAFNYIGWQQPMIWVDSLFANLVFAQQASDALFEFLRLPDRTISLTTWYPGDAPVYPTSMINISYAKSAASGFSFFVTQTHSHRQQGAVPTMTLTGRIVPST